MEANYVHKDSTTLVQDELVKNELNQIELQYNALKQQKFNELLKENQELKKQLEKYQQELEKADSITQSCIFNGKEESKISYRKRLNILDKKETQQKEFIKWLENGIEKVKNTEFLDERIQRAELIAYNRCLRKYKSIIGVSDEKEN